MITLYMKENPVKVPSEPWKLLQENHWRFCEKVFKTALRHLGISEKSSEFLRMTCFIRTLPFTNDGSVWQVHYCDRCIAEVIRSWDDDDVATVVLTGRIHI